MKTLIKNANLITMQKTEDQNIENGQVFIEDNTIVYVGKEYKGNLVADKIIDAKNNIVLPGFINAHAHTAMSIFKNISDDKVLQDWLYEDILPLEQNLTQDIVYNATMLGIAEYVKNGITTFCDAYYYPEASIKAIKKAGIRASVCLGFHTNDATSIEKIEKTYLNNKKKTELITYMLYAHSIYANDEAQITDIVNLANKHKLPVYTHLSETLEEVSNCTVKHNGLTPPQLLEELGFFDLNATVAHAVHVDNQDLDILKNYNVNVVSNPSSNLKLGSGIAPVYSMQKKNINVALGTDGSSSNNALDIFREMYLASTLQKAVLKDASVISATKALRMATVNGAKAINLQNVGKIEKGYKADIIILDTNTPNLTPINKKENSVVYSANTQNVILTMVNGKILYQDDKYYLGEPINDIMKNAKQALNKLKK
jgi:5-methylthioadenosine/S-adenosylhomocysteine deaminase